jgi:hypothetical protein
VPAASAPSVASAAALAATALASHKGDPGVGGHWPGRPTLLLMRHGVDSFSPSSWEPQEEGMMSTAANFPSVRNQGLSIQEKAKLKKVLPSSFATAPDNL